MKALALPPPHDRDFVAGLRAASPSLWILSLVFLAAFAACVALGFADPRLFNGISTWSKPAKFFLSLGLHMLTLSFGLSLLPEAVRGRISTRLAVAAMLAAATGEMLYITFRAARAEASHFNDSSPLAGVLYSAMGFGAALIMLLTAWIGLAVLRHGPRHAVARATGWGFLLAAILTLIVGFTLGGMGSHWIGGDRSDASGLPLLGWSTTGGDLRPAHFIGLHLMQLVPLAAWQGGARLAAAAAILGTTLTALAYVVALMGLPLVAM